MKAQSGSWNVIVATVIGVVVLIVLIFLVSGRINIFASSTNSCEDKGGTCANACGEDYAFTPLGCPEDVPKCCLPQREVPDKVFNWAGDIE